MTPEERQAIEAVLTEMREAASNANRPYPIAIFHESVSTWADRLALLLVEVHQEARDAQNINEKADTRVGDTQYGTPLATASENEPVPTTDGLTFAALRDINRLRCETAFHSVEAWAPWEWSNAMAGECGEACNVTKKMNRIWPANQFQQCWNKPEDQRMADLEAKLADEIADVVIYADLLATRIGRSLGDCVRHKFNEKSDEIGSPIKLLALPEQRVIRQQDDEGKKDDDDQSRGRTPGTSRRQDLAHKNLTADSEHAIREDG